MSMSLDFEEYRVPVDVALALDFGLAFYSGVVEKTDTRRPDRSTGPRPA